MSSGQQGKKAICNINTGKDCMHENYSVVQNIYTVDKLQSKQNPRSLASKNDESKFFSKPNSSLFIPTSNKKITESQTTPYKKVMDREVRSVVSSLKKKTIEEGLRAFGHSSLRNEQKDIINAAMNSRDVVVVMHTGGGKSLCYQLPAFCQSGYAVVVCPLLSLMEDQTKALNAIGVQAEMLNSTQSYVLEQVPILKRLENSTPHGGIKLLYVTPEKLTSSEQLMKVLQKSSDAGLISRFVIDEAHCVNEW